MAKVETNGVAALHPETADDSGPVQPSSRRRDCLAQIERKMQALWDKHRVNEIDAPTLRSQDIPVGEYEGKEEKFFCTFPYPYMNGRLHLGHAFSLTKAEFQARYQRLQGKRVLWPFGFHCTGMPIAACADKLRIELSDAHPQGEALSTPEETPTDTEASSKVSQVVGKFSGKKSKAVSKAGVSKTQWEIMASCGVPEELVPKFQDANFWLSYFPPLAKADLERFGVAVDWRRSFITTQANPYYDLFIRWQFNTLKQRNRICFGMRPAVFSRRDAQPCADHDRASGEGAGPQEYTLVKMKVQKLPEAWLTDPLIAERSVFFVAATLRPETMPGQTNCFVLPTGEYGLYLAFEQESRPKEADAFGILRSTLSRDDALQRCRELFVCSRRSAENMGHQGLVPVELVDNKLYEPICIKQLQGTELMGLPLSAPAAKYATVYALPMMGISMEKGTGIVTSVPSDAPDDYAALRDLQEKPALREKYGITDAMVSLDVVEVVEIPGYGRRAAVDLCNARKVKSQNDKHILEQIKEELYKKGYYEGVLVAGPYKGSKVCDVKDVIRSDMIASGDGLPYYEPEKKVVSRSGDSCVVALCNQWYLDYGDPSWKDAVQSFVSDPAKFTAYSARCHNQFSHVVQWLREWACSRHYGLGTYLPWEIDRGNKILIESLSDSTIYMAYYTVAHLFQGNINGSVPGTLQLTPEQLTDEVLDFIFMQTDQFPVNSTIPKEKLNAMRNEFSYWYPMDLRVSGKDLIFNHLTMTLFNHAAIWPHSQDTKWPRSFFCNGHILVDAEKMSKSAGNFLTLQDAIDAYTADGTRVALADAGDSLDDANFQKENANAALMRLYLLDQFVEEVLEKPESCSFRKGSKLWIDKVFENEIVWLAQQTQQAYDRIQYREALKSGFFDFTSLRDQYRHFCGSDGMHEECIIRWVEIQAVLLAPIAPHICEYIWTVRLRKPSLLVTTGQSCWTSVLNQVAPFNPQLHREYATLVCSVEEFRRTKEKSIAADNSARKKPDQALRPELNAAVVYVAKDYLPWQQTVLKLLQKVPLSPCGRKPLDSNYVTTIRTNPEIMALDKKTTKSVMPFACFRMKEELSSRGPEALELRLPFDERWLMEHNRCVIQRLLGIEHLDIRWSTDVKHPQDSTDRITLAVPSKPSIVFFHVPNI